MFKFALPDSIKSSFGQARSASSLAGAKRSRDIQDIGDKAPKLLALSSVQEVEEAQEQGEDEGPPPTTPASSTRTTRSTKLKQPSERPTRQPLATNPVISNVTTRKRRSTRSTTTAAAKELRPPPSGIIKGQRTAEVEAVNNALSKSAKGKATESSEDDPKWQRFEAARNAGIVVDNKKKLGAEMQEERARVSALRSAQVNLETELRETKNKELIHRRDLLAATDELAEVKRRYEKQLQEMEHVNKQLEKQLKESREDCRLIHNDLKMERDASLALKAAMAQQSNTHLSLQAQLDASQRLARSLQEEVEKRLGSASEMQIQLETVLRRNEILEAEAIENEQLRRKLHNEIQELKGNIRVYVRVRPIIKGEKDEASGEAPIAFPDGRDHKEIVLSSTSESAAGTQRKEVFAFNFDRVFEPRTTQVEVFEEMSQLVQSVTDGYNVTIFAYGQTGSGKSFTMEGGNTEMTEGMIPRAIRRLFQLSDGMKPRGWQYQMEGQFLEIYNETINDLLGQGEFDCKKHEIKHDKSGRTTVTDVVTMQLYGPSEVTALLAKAQSRRSVASTLMNQRSSRSHSVFTLRVTGINTKTGESCEGCLNLVDLAGSERLSSSGAAGDKDRLRETQAINKSLSALGDVIAALGVAGDSGNKNVHIPYRNSKLTYLLQNSLGGNSKTLMVLNLSPTAAHFNESLCSLRFATKVNNTTIGRATAKKVTAS
ncbi:kinesin-domain-containing protein [Serendipita vermifera]|nr:kinesin-domain-containing protein [Serendipita vermifera]